MNGVIFDLGHTLMEFHADWQSIILEGGKQLHQVLQKKEPNLPPAFTEHFIERRRQGGSKADECNREYTAETALRETLEHFGYNGELHDFIPTALEAFFFPEEENWMPFQGSLGVLDG